jgi:hypothetical protein
MFAVGLPTQRPKRGFACAQYANRRKQLGASAVCHRCGLFGEDLGDLATIYLGSSVWTFKSCWWLQIPTIVGHQSILVAELCAPQVLSWKQNNPVVERSWKTTPWEISFP